MSIIYDEIKEIFENEKDEFKLIDKLEEYIINFSCGFYWGYPMTRDTAIEFLE